ncbi:CapA family protein [Boudabousia marimammalium]|uniref:Capsule synthesis protein CapA domain-containing protein n=1 Tax=Boudabousia marimammalium TaxID=156892 RepID=A0A1Q5PJE8_9ACTO|nr:CapA family protein [Boudabousia marimammalium]OKL46012.1 hypothetical protein BM477_07495 [Boudabousia marimammalium]
MNVRRKRRLLRLTAVAAATMVIAGCVASPAVSTDPFAELNPYLTAASPESATTPEPTIEPTPDPASIDIPITIAATGDMLSHQPLTNAATRPDGSVHIKDRMFGVQPFISNADLALCHLEIPFAKTRAQMDNYPEFAAPPEWIDDIRDLGFDGCSSASNHLWDKRLPGLNNTIDMMRQAGLGQAGTNKSPDQPPYQLYQLHREGRDLTIAHLSLTYGTNHGVIPEIQRKPWIANLGDPDRAIAEAKDARAHGADIVIVSMHHGTEYRTDPLPGQLEWAQKFADSGEIDLVLGHHAHVPQPVREYPRPGKPSMWVYFGVGNLISAQRPDMGVLTQVSVIALPTLHVNGLGQVTATDANWVPLVFDRPSFTLYSLDALQKSASEAQIPAPRSAPATLVGYVDKARKVLGEQGHETAQIPTPSGPLPAVVPRDPQPAR